MTAQRKRSGAWSAPELDYLRRWYGTRPIALLARYLRRTPSSVRARARELFAGRRRRDPWTEADDERLRLGYGAVPDAELALALRRTQADVRARAAALRARARARPWTSADDALLKRVYGTRSLAALEVCLQRPAADIEAAARRLCLGKDRRFLAAARAHARMPRWSAAEVARLRALYPTNDNLAVARELGRSVTAVANKANQLGLKKRRAWLRRTGKAHAVRRWRAAQRG